MSAQLEDGYTRTANELLERLMKIKLNGTQHNIIYCIIRNTYGFQRKSHAMSLTFISVAIEAHKDLVKRELDKLIECNIVKVFKDGDYTHSREIGINKNISDWVVHSKPIGRQSTKQSTVSESVGEQSTKQSTPTVDESVYQERKSFKEIKKNTTTSDSDFENVRIAFRELHGVIDLPIQDCTVVTKLLDDSIPPDLIISVMKEKYKPSVKTIKYYVEAIKEKHEGKERVVPMQRKRNEVDWDKVLRQLKEAEQQNESRTGA